MSCAFVVVSMCVFSLYPLFLCMHKNICCDLYNSELHCLWNLCQVTMHEVPVEDLLRVQVVGNTSVRLHQHYEQWILELLSQRTGRCHSYVAGFTVSVFLAGYIPVVTDHLLRPTA